MIFSLATARILPSVVALAMVLPSAKVMVIAIDMTVAMAIYIALADAIEFILFIHNQKRNLNVVSFLAMALDMAIALYMAMALAMAKIFGLGSSLDLMLVFSCTSLLSSR